MKTEKYDRCLDRALLEGAAAPRLLGWLLPVLFGLGPAHGSGRDRARIAFQYTVREAPDQPPGAPCPSEAEVKQAVASRLGYAPWDPSAMRSISVTVTTRGSAFHAAITLRDRAGDTIGTREVSSQEGCAETMAAASLAIAIAIAPIAAMGPEAKAASDHPASKTEPPIQEASRPAAALSAADAPESAVPAPGFPLPSGFLYLGGAGAWGALPGVAGGVDFGGGLRWAVVAVRLGVRYDFPADLATSSGRIVAHDLLGQAAICAGIRWLLGCAGASLGAVWARGVDLPLSRKAAGLAAFAFWRLGAELPLRPWLQLQLFADLTAPMVRQRLLAHRTEQLYWQTPAAGISWGAALVFSIFDGFDERSQ